MKSRGFTLIELLVVIAIIAMLSSIVLASVKSARTKAQAQSQNEIVHAYTIVFEQLINEGYTPGSLNLLSGSAQSSCIGPCGTIYSNLQPASNGTANPQLDALLANYIDTSTTLNSFPVAKTGINNIAVSGLALKCAGSPPGTFVVGRCDNPYLEWWVSGAVQCVKGPRAFSDSTVFAADQGTIGQATRCLYIF